MIEITPNPVLKDLKFVIFLILTIPFTILGFLCNVVVTSFRVGWDTEKDFIDWVAKR